jgi:hypothetical protein
MTNEDIEDFLQDSGYQFIASRNVDAGTISVYFNWRKTAIVIEKSNGQKTLCLEVDKLD